MISDMDRVKPNNVKRVLLVEDNEMWQDKFLQLLGHLVGWEVTIATSHAELATQLTAGQFGALLLDESLWEQKWIYEHQTPIQTQVAGGARVFSLSSSSEAALEMAKAFGTKVSVAWSKRNVGSASSTDLLAAIEG